jgi:peroxiredoxin Q/BCP
MALSVGSRAPDFSAPLSNGTTFTMASARGRPLVLYFYPKDFTPGCTREACNFRDAHSDLVGAYDARVIGVSKDSPASHAAFIKEHALTFDLVSDSDGAIARAYGALHLGGLLPLTKRITYVIDGEGIVRGVFHHELAIDNHVKGVRDALASLPRRTAASP